MKKTVYYFLIILCIVSSTCRKKMPADPEKTTGKILLSLNFPGQKNHDKNLYKKAAVDRVEIGLYQGTELKTTADAVRNGDRGTLQLEVDPGSNYSLTANAYENNNVKYEGTSEIFSIEAGESKSVSITLEWRVTGFSVTLNTNTVNKNEDFSITINAKDANGNKVTTFSSSVNLSDLSNTIIPSSVTLSSGEWTGNVKITENYNNNRIKVSYSGIESYSDYFNVDWKLASFEISSIDQSQEVYKDISITVKAKDSGNNTITTFNEQVTLSDETGTVSPSTITLTNGIWTGNITINAPYTGNKITATYGTVVSSGNTFNLEWVVYSFDISTISDHEVDESFSVTITVKDEQNKTVTTFNSAVTVSDGTNSVSPPSVTLSSGIWTGNITIGQPLNNNRIKVSYGSLEVYSNYFNVQWTLDHFTTSTVSSQIVNRNFVITVYARDDRDNTITSFNSTASLTDETGSATPTTITFSDGVYVGNVKISQPKTDDRLKVLYGTVQNYSNYFNVDWVLDHFEINNIYSPQTAGEDFAFTVFAKDILGNTITTFNNTVNMTDESGTISPISVSFNSGVWSGGINISGEYTSDRIKVYYGNTESYSNYFDVITSVPSDFSHLLIDNISSPRNVNEDFEITVYAKDASNNTLTSFNNTINLSDVTGSLTPKNVTMTAGEWTGNVNISEPFSGNKIRVSYGSNFAYSNSFDVTWEVDYFEIGNISSPQYINENFTITIYAKDSGGNIITNFNNNASISDMSGSLNISSLSFTNGVCIKSASVSQKYNNNRITVNYIGNDYHSNYFDVLSSQVHDLDHFTISSISSPQYIDQNIPVTIYARDSQNNNVTTFNNTVNLSDESGSISPSSITFTDGVWNGNITVSQEYANNRILVSFGSVSKYSNYFDVISSASTGLDYFEIGYISPTQYTGENFVISVYAKDVLGNTITTFNNTVNLTDETGTISPSSVTFISGMWIGNVKISQEYSNDRILVSYGSVDDYSNYFNVITLNMDALDHFDLGTVSSPQYVDQPFTLTITAKNVQSSTITSFNNEVTLTDETGTLTPSTATLSNGAWSGVVQIGQLYTGNKIKVTYNTVSKYTNTFDVEVDSNVTVLIPNTTGGSGEYVSIPVRVSGITDQQIIGVTLVLEYDKNLLDIAGISTQNSLGSGWILSYNENYDTDKIKISGGGAYPVDENGVMFYIKFYVNNYAPGTYTDIKISGITLEDVDGNTITVTARDGKYTVN